MGAADQDDEDDAFGDFMAGPSTNNQSTPPPQLVNQKPAKTPPKVAPVSQSPPQASAQPTPQPTPQSAPQSAPQPATQPQKEKKGIQIQIVRK